jgi:hypothetical protein
VADTDKTAQFLADITSNLATYIEEQAQLIAKPKIEAAERAWERRMDEDQETHAIRERRSAELIKELRRRISVMERHEERWVLKERRVRAVADDLDARDLREAATDVLNALNFVGHMKAGTS